jgi:hypothetical protein
MGGAPSAPTTFCAVALRVATRSNGRHSLQYLLLRERGLRNPSVGEICVCVGKEKTRRTERTREHDKLKERDTSIKEAWTGNENAIPKQNLRSWQDRLRAA